MILKFEFVEPETVKMIVNWSWHKKNRHAQIKVDIKRTNMHEWIYRSQ